MTLFNARVTVTLKNGVLDPQGKAIEGSLSALGIKGVEHVRQGKVFEISLNAASKDTAIESLNAMCEQLLANTVIEDYCVEIVA